MTKDELNKALNKFSEENPPLEWEYTDDGERLDLLISDTNNNIADACYITHALLASPDMENLLEARLAEVKRAYKEMIND